MSLEEYKKKELSQQILDEPDTYVGGTDMIEDTLPVFKDGNIVVQNTQYIPAIIKLSIMAIAITIPSKFSENQ